FIFFILLKCSSNERWGSKYPRTLYWSTTGFLAQSSLSLSLSLSLCVCVFSLWMDEMASWLPNL
ncbi:MAG: hypothetical protein N7Q72_05445, partial [Spiroplasma sp. Tabriz.8]|nr:hypothetical protein [Spiroplasma sp. Tabriz.8]